VEGRVSFDRFELDLSAGRLSGQSGPIPLTPKALAVLEYLAARPGRLIGKDELLAAIWPGVFLGEGALKVCVSEIRRALGDDARKARIIETAHRRGYRFIAEVIGSSPAPTPPLALPEASPLRLPVQYAHSGDVHIAYQVLGSGPIDLVFVMGWVSHLEYFWNEPSFARFLRRLASFSRLILFDKRGTGLSDAVPVSELPTLEQRLDDVRAVMQAAGSQRAVLLGISEGGPLCSLFAATYPEKTEALIMIGSYARRLRDPEYPWGPTREDRDAFCRTIVEQWGGPVGVEDRAPSRAADPAFREWWASYLRMGASPGAAVALTRMNAEIDIRNVLPTIRVPTLVLHRTGDRCLKIDEGRYLASRIPGATFIELPGEDHLPFVGDQDAILREIGQFVTRTHVRAAAGCLLASVVTVRSDASRDDWHLLRQVFDREVAWSRGEVFEADGLGLVATFDGPGRAVQCAAAVVAIAGRLRLTARAGVHIGECHPGVVEGPILDICADLANAAGPGEVVVSRTVVDLLSGSGLEFNERGQLRVQGGAAELPVLALDGR
jgi:pimeloyl-ACP methyl ester carboxylesterase/DNA-binding winged helix-turn-helix (wHTH) protein